MKRALILGLMLAFLCSVGWALTCPKCTKEVPAGAKFCPSCGQKFAFRCPKCKEKASPDSKFCPKCGTKLKWPGGPPKPKPEPPATPSMDSGEIFAKSSSAVVRIEIRDKAKHQTASGSGFLVSADGYIVTNYHVIRTAWSATVVMNDKKKLPVLGYAAVSPEHDLALIRVNGKDMPALQIAPGGRPKVGRKVCAIGYPKGLPCTLSEGIVSGQPKLPFAGKPIELVQTTAAISPGSSGGPLLSGYGKILVEGVTSGSIPGGQSLNLAIPAGLVRDLLGKKRTIRRLPPPLAKIPIPPPPEDKPKYERKFTDPFDQEVQKGIDRAVKYLWSTRKEDGSWKAVGLQIGGEIMQFPAGPTALMCFALLESGVSPQDKRMAKSLRWLGRQKTTKTYTLALRANAYLAAGRSDAKYLKDLAEDVKALVKGTKNGSYTYDCPGGSMVGDNSNSQYGLLGVWAGAKANLEDIPKQYWDVVAKHWAKTQNPDGGWGYHARHRARSYPSMTVAGLASMFVCSDNLQADKFAKCGVNAKIPAIDKGLRWLEEIIKKISLDSLLEAGAAGKVNRLPLDMYYLFGVERVALASGYKYFGSVPWYRTGATRILKSQQDSGAVWGGGFGDVNVGTAYALLFLVRGRHPVVFNKLKFESDWNNRPRDMAVLTRWLSTTFERTLNWQIIDLKDPVEDWHDAPILYISGSKDPNFTGKHIETLRTFVHQGGTLFTVTECSGMAFRRQIREAYAKMFPKYKLRPLDQKHDLFSVHFKVRGLQFHMITNGVRPLAIHCDFDLPLSWQQRRTKTRKWTFQVAANIAMYVTGKGAFHPRGITHWPADKKFQPTKTAKLVRLKHGGNHDPEPLAFERFRRLLAQRSKIKLEVLGPMPIADLPGSGAKLAALTGTGALAVSSEDKQALKSFVAGGGTLVIDAAGGNAEFDKSARALLSELYGPKLRMLATVSELLTQKGMEIKRVRYRGRARIRLGRTNAPSLRAVTIDKRPAVIYSREDITCGLVGYESTTCDGYDVDSAYEIMRNIVNLAG